MIEGADRIHVFADTIHIDGVVAYDKSPAGVVFNAVHDIVVTGLVYSLGAIELNAGVDPAWDQSVLTGGNIPVAQLGPGSIYVYGAGQLHSETEVRLHAGGDVHVLAAAQDSDEQIQLLLPYVTQQSVTIEVITGSHQVQAGTIWVPEVHWVPTIITEQVGYELVQVGSYYNTMDVTLEQIGYYNPHPPTPFTILPMFPTMVFTSGSSPSYFAGPPNDSASDLGNGGWVVFDFGAYRICNRSGGDFNVYEEDWGMDEFEDMTVEVSENGSFWVNVRGTQSSALVIPGDGAHSSTTFRRSYDIAGSGLSSVRFVRVRGTDSDFFNGGFELDAIGAFVVAPNPSAAPLPEIMTYFVEGADYFNAQIDWSGVGTPAASAAFHDLNEAQRQRILDTLGYQPLYDFSYTNARRHETINGTPSERDWEPDWADNTPPSTMVPSGALTATSVCRLAPMTMFSRGSRKTRPPRFETLPATRTAPSSTTPRTNPPTRATVTPIGMLLFSNGSMSRLSMAITVLRAGACRTGARARDCTSSPVIRAAPPSASIAFPHGCRARIGSAARVRTPA